MIRQDEKRREKRDARREITRQDKRRHEIREKRDDTTRQEKTRHNKTRQDKTRQKKTRQDKTEEEAKRKQKTRACPPNSCHKRGKTTYKASHQCAHRGKFEKGTMYVTRSG